MTITARVPDEVLWAAVRDGLRDPSLGSVAQWAAVADYAAGRGPDPSQQRAERALGLAPDQQREAWLEWLREDVATAAPLMGAFTSHDTDIEHPEVEVGAAERARLGEWLRAQTGSVVDVVDAKVIGGGFSRRMWRVRLADADGERGVIVRIEQGGMFGTDTATEVRSMRALHDVGFALPAVLHVEPTGTVLGEPFFVMEQVPGVVRVDDDGLADIIRSVAALHSVPASVLDDSGRSAEQVVADTIEYWRRLYRAHAPEHPLLEHSAAWLHAHLRPTGPTVIVHGDAGPGNALFDAERGLTTIDWEFAHVGDAAEDWAYLALIRGRRTMGADEWKQRLADVAGVRLDDEQWRNWLAFGHFRGACVNLTARTVFERGPRRTADQLAIGVAVHLRFLSQLVDITCA